MIKDKSEMANRPIEIDLNGPDGNAYELIGLAHSLAKQIYAETEEERVDRIADNTVSYDLLDIEILGKYWKADSIVEEMKSGDYENLIKVFDNYFGSIVTLYR